MAALVKTTRAAAPHAVTVNTLSASDTLTYDPTKNQEMELRNTTASPVTVTIDGSGASAALEVPGTGGTTLDLSAGKDIIVPGVIGATVRVPLNSLSKYLVGNVVVTGGVGVTATILTD